MSRRCGYRWPRGAGAFGLVVVVAACGAGEPEQRAFTGDLSQIDARGFVRFLIPAINDAGVLPRGRTPLQAEQRVAEWFAVSRGLEPVWVPVAEYDQLIPALLAGRGDVIVANLSVTPGRQRDIAFGAPLVRVHEVAVTHRDSAPVATAADLVGRTVTVRRSSAYWSTLDSLARIHPEITVVAAPEEADTEELLYRVARGELDVTLADNLIAEVARSYMPVLRVDATLSGPRSIAWGVRPSNPMLRDTIDAFIAQTLPSATAPVRSSGDLTGIRQRGVLRVLTRNNPTSYFVWRGQILGFEHDLVTDFARSLGVRVEFIVAPTRAAVITWLLDGVGDIAAAGLTRGDTAERLVAYSRSYNRVVEMAVTDTADTALRSPADLAGRTVAARVSSSYWETATRLREEGIALELQPVPEDMETEEVLDAVATGAYDVAFADSPILEMELTWRDDIRGAFPVTDTVDYAWMVQPGDTALLAAINAYFDRAVRGTFYNLTKTKYFGNPKASRRYVTGRPERTGAISPYDDLARRYASRYGFDWILITAQMYEESRFDPNVVSFAGAVGLMQVMPQTAHGFGFRSLREPAVNIHAGTRYLRHVYGLLDDVPDSTERYWFALAAYNAGLGHINDARRLAEEQGRDPDVWFGSVAEVAPLLQRRAVHQRFQFGYCRCNEPVAYVRKIRERRQAYGVVARQ